MADGLHTTAALVEHYSERYPLWAEILAQIIPEAIDALYKARNDDKTMHGAGAAVAVAVLEKIESFNVDGPAPDPASWGCTIGELPRAFLPEGADSPMRQAVESAYFALTQQEPLFCFSGWGVRLDAAQREALAQRA